MVRAFWYISNNFGDNLNHYLISELSEQQVVYNAKDKPHYIVCGSILADANEHSTVWGAGFGSQWQWQGLDGQAKINMVRGYKSAELIKDTDFGLLGDPAVLLPLLYMPTTEKKYKTAIIPHYVDMEMCIAKYGHLHHIIDPFLPIKEFIDEVAASENIISSSLHGLIVADSYKVPNSWIDFGSLSGDGFKFGDYYSTTHQRQSMAINRVSFQGCTVKDYEHNLYKLALTCPFLSEELKRKYEIQITK
jgi:pyruvyltransferase